MYQYKELGWFGSGCGLLESPCECGIEPPGSIRHGVSYYEHECFYYSFLFVVHVTLKII